MAPLWQRAGYAARLARESLLAGGERRRRAVDRLYSRHHEARRRLDWDLVAEQPHFFDHRIGAARIAAGTAGELSNLLWARAYYTADVLRPADAVLDIGCGDGFFTKYFYAACARRVDAIDIEESAIAHASRHSAAENIAYFIADATRDPFPSAEYDAVVFDGALGHFSPDTTGALLEKIAGSLRPGGIFVGSETLGRVGADHLQYFDAVEDLASTLHTAFDDVRTRVLSHATPTGRRVEAYWRCPVDPDGAARGAWFSAPAPSQP